MLKRLTLENIAIIEALTVSFEAGLTVITGETGSGKSILMESIGLAFGTKVPSREIIRAGATRARVEMVLDPIALKTQEPLLAFLATQDLEILPGESEILISREFTPTGSRCRFNGTPVTREFLEQLRPYFLDFHGQHDLTGLFHKATQRSFLDALGGTDVAQLKRQVAECFGRWQAIKQKLSAILEAQKTFEQRRDFLMFQLQELTEAELTTETEDTDCQQERERLMHAERLRQGTTEAIELLSENDWDKAKSVSEMLGKVSKLLTEALRWDTGLTELSDRATALREECRTLSYDLTAYLEDLEVEPERIQNLVDRLDLLEKLKRKYGGSLAEVIQTRDQLAAELSEEERSEQNLEALESACRLEEETLQTLCGQLTEKRRTLADSLKTMLVQELKSLALPSVCFDLELRPISYSSEGAEEIEFLFSANPGEPVRPLAKVASGGELSRFLLALKVLTAEQGGMQSLIFDEIDTGMSGSAAKSVGEKLLHLAHHLQVFVITHQPIVAAMGDHHLHVQKRVIGKELEPLKSGKKRKASEPVDMTEKEVLDLRVQVEVTMLEEKEKRLNVLSRLASGIDTDDEAVENYIHRLFHQANAWKTEKAVL